MSGSMPEPLASRTLATFGSVDGMLLFSGKAADLLRASQELAGNGWQAGRRHLPCL